MPADAGRELLVGYLRHLGPSWTTNPESVTHVPNLKWNDIFIYVIDSFREHNRMFECLVAGIQEHEERIQRFFGTLPPELQPSMDVGSLPPIWQRRVLVVEDNRLLRQLIADMLGKHSRVDSAENGREALERIRDHCYNVIVTDIQMPVIDGIEFYRQAVDMESFWRERFLFMTMDMTLSRRVFLEKNGLPFLLKPFSPDELVQAVESVAHAA